MVDAIFLPKPEVEIAAPIIKPEMMSQTAVELKPENKMLAGKRPKIAAKVKKISPLRKGGSKPVLQLARVIRTSAAL